MVFEDWIDKFEFGKGIELLEGKDGYIIACGIMVAYALEAAKQLRAEGFDAGVIDMHTIKPLDTELVLRAAARTGRLVTVEDAFITGGLGGAVCETIAEGGVPCRVKRLGIPDIFPGFGSFNEQMEHLGFGIAAMKQAVRAL